MICAHANTEATESTEKDTWYEQLQAVIDGVPRHDFLVLLGDFNAKVGRETEAFYGTIGSHSLHPISNDNGIRLVTFAAQNSLLIGGTVFPHKPIHNGDMDIPGWEYYKPNRSHPSPQKI